MKWKYDSGISCILPVWRNFKEQFSDVFFFFFRFKIFTVSVSWWKKLMLTNLDIMSGVASEPCMNGIHTGIILRAFFLAFC